MKKAAILDPNTPKPRILDIFSFIKENLVKKSLIGYGKGVDRTSSGRHARQEAEAASYKQRAYRTIGRNVVLLEAILDDYLQEHL